MQNYKKLHIAQKITFLYVVYVVWICNPNNPNDMNLRIYNPHLHNIQMICFYMRITNANIQAFRILNPKEQKTKKDTKKEPYARIWLQYKNNYLLPNLCPFGFWDVHCIAFLDSECLVEIVDTDELSVYSPLAERVNIFLCTTDNFLIADIVSPYLCV